GLLFGIPSRRPGCRRRRLLGGRHGGGCLAGQDWDALDPHRTGAAEDFFQGGLDPSDARGPLTVLSFLIVASREANYQCVWPKNCRSFRFPQITAQETSYLLQNLCPYDRQGFRSQKKGGSTDPRFRKGTQRVFFYHRLGQPG